MGWTGILIAIVEGKERNPLTELDESPGKGLPPLSAKTKEAGSVQQIADRCQFFSVSRCFR